MKVVVFEPTYSFYFSDLTREFCRELGLNHEMVSFSFSPADKCYLSGFKRIAISMDSVDLSPQSIDKVKSIKSLVYSNDSNENEVNFNLALVHSFLMNYFIRNANSICFIYNDMRWLHALAIDVCKQLSIPYIVFERGVFRPHTTTFDLKGVNANSKFRSMSVDNVDFSDEDMGLYFSKRQMHPHINIRFATYFCMKKIHSLFMPRAVKVIERSVRNKSFADYAKLFIKTIRRTRPRNAEPTFSLARYIFVPLQLSNDTQTLLHSRFASTQQFIDEVTNDFFASPLSVDTLLVFKVHPMDVDEYQFDPRVHVSDLDTQVLVEKSVAVVTINSTVGFEACFKKPVICLGDSFYTDHGYVVRYDKSCGNDNMFNYLPMACVAGDNYKRFTLKSYQLPGSIFNYTKQDISYSANKIISLLNLY